MPYFVILGNWTDQGIRNVQDAPERAKKVHSMFEKAGAKMQLYYTLGEYDFIAVVEAPNDEEVMKVLLCLGSMGNVRTKTLKAWSEGELAKALSQGHPFEKLTEPL
jgi:uncharacterized protein with GYD domain